MPDKDIFSEAEPRAWTTPDAYMLSLARRRTQRRSREPVEARSEPETPRFALSTLPFLALLCGLAILTAGIAYLAMPTSAAAPVAQAGEKGEREPGKADKGWMQDAEREFHG